MSQRLFVSALVGLAALSAGAPPARALPAGPAGAKATPTTFSIYYRGKGRPTWHLFGHYATEESAKRVRQHLAGHGYEVQVRRTNTPIPKTPPRKPTGNLPVAETVHYTKAVEAFRWMAGQRDIAFRFPIDGCYARAELMVERMRGRGYKPRKVWSVANGEELYARTKNHPRGYVTWGYHVAPVLRVRLSGDKQRWYVIDPSLFNRPATVEEWEAAQMRTPRSHKPYLTVTKLGQAPVWIDHKRKNGTGYWPGSDPREGPHKHAVATMKKYKPWEGKDPPRGVVALPGWAPDGGWQRGEAPLHPGLTERRRLLAA